MNKPTFPSTKTNLLLGPLRISQPQPKNYEPVDCDFTDDLEFISINEILVEVKFWASKGTIICCVGMVKDILTKEKEEFLIMSDASKIRLDRIFEVRILNDGYDCA